MLGESMFVIDRSQFPKDITWDPQMSFVAQQIAAGKSVPVELSAHFNDPSKLVVSYKTALERPDTWIKMGLGVGIVLAFFLGRATK